MNVEEHRCRRFRRVRTPGPWRSAGLWRERDVDLSSVCAECGQDRAGRFRKIVAIEREAASAAAAQVDPSLRSIARRLDALLRGRSSARADALLRRLGGVRAESELERAAAVAPLRLEYRRRAGSLQLHRIHVLDGAALSEWARPGESARREAVRLEELQRLAGASHPEALLVADLLRQEDAPRLEELMMRALAGLALLVEAGEARPARVFSGEVLGDSKALARMRPRLERMVGPLDRLGIRDHAAYTYFGGSGTIRMPGVDLDVGRLRGIGLANDDVLALQAVQVPPGGLLVVENFTSFQACSERLREEALVLWSGGFPSRAVTSLVEKVVASGARVRAWCDLDLGGVRIVRQLYRHAPSLEPVIMGPDVVRSAQVQCPLSAAQRARIERDLEMHPDAPLADTLAALLEVGAWVEQETLTDWLPSLRKLR